MSDMLDSVVPDEILQRILPEDASPRMNIQDLSDSLPLASLQRLPSAEVEHLVAQVESRGYKVHVIEAGDNRTEVLYYRQWTPDVQEAISLRSREMGLELPPLTLREHLREAELWGASEEQRETLRKAIETAMVLEGIANGQAVGCGAVGMRPGGYPTLMIQTPSSALGMAPEFARLNADELGMIVHEGGATAYTVLVEAKDGDTEALKTRLDAANIAYQEIANKEAVDENAFNTRVIVRDYPASTPQGVIRGDFLWLSQNGLHPERVQGSETGGVAITLPTEELDIFDEVERHDLTRGSEVEFGRTEGGDYDALPTKVSFLNEQGEVIGTASLNKNHKMYTGTLAGRSFFAHASSDLLQAAQYQSGKVASIRTEGKVQEGKPSASEAVIGTDDFDTDDAPFDDEPTSGEIARSQKNARRAAANYASSSKSHWFVVWALNNREGYTPVQASQYHGDPREVEYIYDRTGRELTYDEMEKYLDKHPTQRSHWESRVTEKDEPLSSQIARATAMRVAKIMELQPGQSLSLPGPGGKGEITVEYEEEQAVGDDQYPVHGVMQGQFIITMPPRGYRPGYTKIIPVKVIKNPKNRYFNMKSKGWGAEQVNKLVSTWTESRRVTEALTAKDKAVVNAFMGRQPAKSKWLESDGKALLSQGAKIAYWVSAGKEKPQTLKTGREDDYRSDMRAQMVKAMDGGWNTGRIRIADNIPNTRSHNSIVRYLRSVGGEKIEEAVRDYGTRKPKTDPTYSAQWSGKTGAPRMRGKFCAKCGGPVFREADSAYCPSCDDYVSTVDRRASRRNERVEMVAYAERTPKGWEVYGFDDGAKVPLKTFGEYTDQSIIVAWAKRAGYDLHFVRESPKPRRAIPYGSSSTKPVYASMNCVEREVERLLNPGVQEWAEAEDEEMDDGDLAVECPACGGEGVPMGGLGNRMHYRCRACGMDFSHEIQERAMRNTGPATVVIFTDTDSADRARAWLDANPTTYNGLAAVDAGDPIRMGLSGNDATRITFVADLNDVVGKSHIRKVLHKDSDGYMQSKSRDQRVRDLAKADQDYPYHDYDNKPVATTAHRGWGPLEGKGRSAAEVEVDRLLGESTPICRRPAGRVLKENAEVTEVHSHAFTIRFKYESRQEGEELVRAVRETARQLNCKIVESTAIAEGGTIRLRLVSEGIEEHVIRGAMWQAAQEVNEKLGLKKPDQPEVLTCAEPAPAVNEEIKAALELAGPRGIILRAYADTPEEFKKLLQSMHIPEDQIAEMMANSSEMSKWPKLLAETKDAKRILTAKEVAEAAKAKPKKLLVERSGKGRQPKLAMEDSDDEMEVKRSYVQFIKQGNSFSPAGEITLKPKLDRSCYEVQSTMNGPVFVKMKSLTDQMYHFPSSTMSKIAEEIERFWKLKENFSRLGLLHRRGILVYGAPGPQPLDAGVLTPTGWVRMGDIQVGDVVCTPDGMTAKVLQTHEFGERDVYDISFDDGTVVRASDEHYWPVHNSHRLKDHYRLRRTDDLASGGKRGSHPNYTRPIAPVAGESRKLPINPYVLGLLLGDGCFRKPSQGVWVTYTEAAGIRAKEIARHHAIQKTHGIHWKVKVSKELLGLGLMGCLSQDKFIPPQYITASVQDRRELLAGLMDTDGGVQGDGKSYFASTSRRLVDGVTALVQSLGGRASVCSYQDKRGPHPVYRLNICTDFNPFKMDPKHTRRWVPQRVFRYVRSVEKTSREAVRCITIDHPEHLYITDGYIPTHNCGKSVMLQQVAESMTAAGDVVFFVRSIGALIEGLKAFRDVEPDRRVVIVIEDADECLQYSEQQFLQLLDGKDAQQNVLYVATTNYLNRFPPRMLRPGRFDKKIHLGPPPMEGRRVYLQKKLDGIENPEVIEDLATRSDGLSFGHLRELVVGVYALGEPVDEVLARLKDLPNPEE